MSTMKRGDKGSAVKALQKRLAKLKTRPRVREISGRFDSTTEDAVEFVQKSAGLKVTGMVDRETEKAIHSMGLPPLTWPVPDMARPMTQLTKKILEYRKRNQKLQAAVKGNKDPDIKHEMRGYNIYYDAFVETTDYLFDFTTKIQICRDQFGNVYKYDRKYQEDLVEEAKQYYKDAQVKNHAADKLLRAVDLHVDALEVMLGEMV